MTVIRFLERDCRELIEILIQVLEVASTEGERPSVEAATSGKNR